VESDLGIVDARLETQLRVLENALLENQRPAGR
jgi:flagellar biosynthesis/type III secretory pathway protein FliH